MARCAVQGTVAGFREHLMGDWSRRYRAIKARLTQCDTLRLTGHRQQHLNTVVAMIGGRCAHVPAIADHAPD